MVTASPLKVNQYYYPLSIDSTIIGSNKSLIISKYDHFFDITDYHSDNINSPAFIFLGGPMVFFCGKWPPWVCKPIMFGKRKITIGG